MINFLLKSLLVDRADLIDSDFSALPSVNDLESALPMGMKSRG
jgi:hypothetical protein